MTRDSGFEEWPSVPARGNKEATWTLLPSGQPITLHLPNRTTYEVTIFNGSEDLIGVLRCLTNSLPHRNWDNQKLMNLTDEQRGRRTWRVGKGHNHTESQAVAVLSERPEQELGKFRLRLYAFAVDPAVRGQGVGEFLIEIISVYARETGFDELILDVSVKEDVFVEYLKTLGFRPTRVRDKKQGKVVELVYSRPKG